MQALHLLLPTRNWVFQTSVDVTFLLLLLCQHSAARSRGLSLDLDLNLGACTSRATTRCVSAAHLPAGPGIRPWSHALGWD
jgi:hypothetical protein